MTSEIPFEHATDLLETYHRLQKTAEEKIQCYDMDKKTISLFLENMEKIELELGLPKNDIYFDGDFHKRMNSRLDKIEKENETWIAGIKKRIDELEDREKDLEENRSLRIQIERLHAERDEIIARQNLEREERINNRFMLLSQKEQDIRDQRDRESED